MAIRHQQILDNSGQSERGDKKGKLLLEEDIWGQTLNDTVDEDLKTRRRRTLYIVEFKKIIEFKVKLLMVND